MSERRPRALDPEEMAAWAGFVGAAFYVTGVIDRELAGCGVNHTDYAVLSMLSDSPGRRRRMSEIADLLQVDRSLLTYRVKRLERAGLVERSRHVPEDRRGTYAALTERGAAFLAKVWPWHVDGVRRHFVDHLSRDQLRDVADAMRALNADRQPAEQAPQACRLSDGDVGRGSV